MLMLWGFPLRMLMHVIYSPRKMSNVSAIAGVRSVVNDGTIRRST
jgi:hypothetical protein